jgi:uncharacterized membrane protein
MNASRPLTFLTGVALLGLGGALISRAFSSGDEDVGPHNPDAAVPYRAGERIEKVFTIDRPAADLYREWRALENLPTIMSHLERVEVLDERRSRWHAHGPAGIGASWEAEIIADEPDERIAWRSIGGNVPNAGSVTFAPAPGERGTELRVEMEWAPPAGPLGKSFAHLFAGGDPGLIVESDLRRFKSKLEAGDVAVNGTDVKA